MADCNGGQNAVLNVNNTDCSCVSISSIVWNPAGTQFTITLNNGQSITSPDLTGPDGVPTISFRVSGTTLQYSINGGTSWVSIYDLSGLIGTSVIHNDVTDSTTVTNALEVLKTFTMDAGQMAGDGDILHIHARFRKNTDAVLGFCYAYLDGANIINEYMIDSNDGKCTLDAYITRTDANDGKGDLTTWKVSTGTQTYPISAVAVSAWADALDIEIKANDNSGNAITCELFQVFYTRTS